jgi:hypothetical protein
MSLGQKSLSHEHDARETRRQFRIALLYLKNQLKFFWREKKFNKGLDGKGRKKKVEQEKVKKVK